MIYIFSCGAVWCCVVLWCCGGAEEFLDRERGKGHAPSG